MEYFEETLADMDGRPGRAAAAWGASVRPSLGAPPRPDCARWWMNEDAAESGGAVGDAIEDRVLGIEAVAEGSCRTEGGWGRAPPGLLMRLLRRSARYAAGDG